MYKLLKNNNLKYVDLFIRLLMSHLIKLYIFKESFKRYKFKYSSYTPIYFLYGGIGDIVMQIYFINEINISDQILICELNKSDLIKKLVTKNIVLITYKKSELFNDMLRIKKLMPNNGVFIFFSPIYEVFIIYLILNIKNYFGILIDYKYFYSKKSNIKYCIQGINKVDNYKYMAVKYNEIYCNQSK